MENTFELVHNRRLMDECLDLIESKPDMAGVSYDREEVHRTGSSRATSGNEVIGRVFCDGLVAYLLRGNTAEDSRMIDVPSGQVLVLVPPVTGQRWPDAVSRCEDLHLQLLVRDDQAWICRAGEFVVDSPVDGTPQVELIPVQLLDYDSFLAICTDGEPRMVSLADIGGVEIAPGVVMDGGPGGVSMGTGR